MIERNIAALYTRFQKIKVPTEVLAEAQKRVLDSLGCYYGAFDSKPSVLLRKTFSSGVTGPSSLWGVAQSLPAETSALLNGAGVRALDFNDTYLSKEPCHPSDLLSSAWAAAEISAAPNQGQVLLEGLVLGYDVLCRLCDAASIRKRGWDHVTYLPVASAVACSYILGLSTEAMLQAVSLALTGRVALRQTRVGVISDWKAACAASAAQAGLQMAQLARAGFTGPSHIFEGKHGFWAQVSGPFSFSAGSFGKPWMIMKTHTKFFPAEHHAQSAIEAALALRKKVRLADITAITIHCFDVAFQIIGCESEKWRPTTRETADHSLPYLVVAALLDGTVSLEQFAKKRFMDADVVRLLKKVRVKSSKAYTRVYPDQMPTTVELTLKKGAPVSNEVLKPLGYAGRPMSLTDVVLKFEKLSARCLRKSAQEKLIASILNLRTVKHLRSLQPLMTA